MFVGYRDAVQIGEGGLGRVFRAVRISTGGIVAIKELHEVPSASPAWHRAKRELEAMLRLKGHPYVVSVEEIIDSANGPCLVMEYLEGGSLMQRLERVGPLSTPEFMLVGQQVSQALAAAHETGVVHRDVKPHNLLVGSFGQVKVADFGIAALTREAGLHTRTQAFTLAYASPEELDGDAHIGPPADAYSFAATMAHLASGHKPSHREKNAARNLQQLESEWPIARPVIVALQQCLTDDPVGRPTMHELQGLFVSGASQLGAAAISRLTVSASPHPALTLPPPEMAPPAAPPTVVHSTRANGQEAPPTVVRSSPGGGAAVTVPDRPPTSGRRRGGKARPWVIAAVGATAVIAVIATIALTKNQSPDDQAATTTAATATTVEGGAALDAIRLSSNTVTLEIGGTEQLVITGSRGAVDAASDAVSGATWESSSTDVATVDSAGVVTAVGAGTAIITARVGGLSSSATFTVNAATTTGPPLPSTGAEVAKMQHQSAVLSAAYSPDGSSIVTATKDGAVTLWNTNGSKQRALQASNGHTGAVNSVTFSPDGQYVLTAGADATAKLWNLTGTVLHTYTGHGGEVRTAVFSPDGTTVLTASDDGTAVRWNRETEQQLTTYPAASGRLLNAVFNHDGTEVLASNTDGTAERWSIDGTRLYIYSGSNRTVSWAAYSPSGDAVLLSLNEGGKAELWSLADTPLATFSGHSGNITQAVVNAQGTQVLTAGSDGTARLFNIDGRSVAIFTPDPRLYAVVSVAFSPDGATILTAGRDWTAKTWTP